MVIEEDDHLIGDLITIAGVTNLMNISKEVCIRCGKVRVVKKTYKEYVGTSLVITTLTKCPDPDCQKKLDDQFEKERVQRENFNTQKLNTDRSTFFLKKTSK